MLFLLIYLYNILAEKGRAIFGSAQVLTLFQHFEIIEIIHDSFRYKSLESNYLKLYQLLTTLSERLKTPRPSNKFARKNLRAIIKVLNVEQTSHAGLRCSL